MWLLYNDPSRWIDNTRGIVILLIFRLTIVMRKKTHNNKMLRLSTDNS